MNKVIFIIIKFFVIRGCGILAGRPDRVIYPCKESSSPIEGKKTCWVRSTTLTSNVFSLSFLSGGTEYVFTRTWNWVQDWCFRPIISIEEVIPVSEQALLIVPRSSLSYVEGTADLRYIYLQRKVNGGRLISSGEMNWYSPNLRIATRQTLRLTQQIGAYSRVNGGNRYQTTTPSPWKKCE